jgi:hypothetical protein
MYRRNRISKGKVELCFYVFTELKVWWRWRRECVSQVDSFLSAPFEPGVVIRESSSLFYLFVWVRKGETTTCKNRYPSTIHTIVRVNRRHLTYSFRSSTRYKQNKMFSHQDSFFMRWASVQMNVLHWKVPEERKWKPTLPKQKNSCHLVDILFWKERTKGRFANIIYLK